MFIEVLKAEYVDGYRIRLWFNNNVNKVLDLKSSLKGIVFEPIKRFKFLQEILGEIQYCGMGKRRGLRTLVSLGLA